LGKNRDKNKRLLFLLDFAGLLICNDPFSCCYCLQDLSLSMVGDPPFAEITLERLARVLN
jgi:hypothetical protein